MHAYRSDRVLLCMKITVLVPTYRRTDSLQRCLEGLQRQMRMADEVLVVVHRSDEVSREFVESWRDWSALRMVLTPDAGQVNQLNAGLDASTGEIIAITDDDAVPQPQWLERIEHHFARNADLGGVGGRDFVWEHGALLSGEAQTVGTILWFGRIVGNHHIGSQLRSRIDILKGVNMSYRASAIQDLRFDTDLRGQGAQTCNDMAFSLGVQSRGWRLLFDPEAAVDHYPAPRLDADKRGAPSLEAVENRSFNFYLTLRRHLRKGVRRQVTVAWARWVGAANTPGLLRGIVSRLRNHAVGIENRAAAQRAWTAVRELDPPRSGNSR